MKTLIGYVRIQTNRDEEFANGILELENYESTVKYADGSSVVINVLESIEYSVEVDEDLDGVISVTGGNGFVVAYMLYLYPDKQKKLDLLREHYDKLNRKLKDNLNEITEKSKRIITKNSNEIEVKQLLRGFLNKTDHSIFLTFDNIICFERMLYHRFRMGKELLFSYEWNQSMLLYNSILDDFEESVDIVFLDDYYNEYFEKLVKVIEKKINIKRNDIGSLVTWRLILNEVREYYYDEFSNNYGEYFYNENNLGLDDYLEIYLTIDIIDVYSPQNAAVFTYYLMYLNKFKDSNNFISCFNFLLPKLMYVIKDKELEEFEQYLLKDDKKQEYTINDVDLMTGYEFEEFVSHLFKKMGYSTELTKSSYDQGIDIIIEKNSEKIGIQTKRYSSKVNNQAIQEVVAGLRHYNLRKGIVITSNYFTNSALELAGSNDVILWDREMLKEKILTYF